MEEDEDNPSPNSEGKDTNDTESHSNNNRQIPNKIDLNAGRLSVSAESVDESVESLAEVCSIEMERLMRYHIRGELEVLEEENLHNILLGDD